MTAIHLAVPKGCARTVGSRPVRRSGGRLLRHSPPPTSSVSKQSPIRTIRIPHDVQHRTHVATDGGSPNGDRSHSLSCLFAAKTTRVAMRRFTRLTNAFSKKLENHTAAIRLHFMYYNFGRVHQTLRCTPAMRAGISDHIWSIEEIVGLLEKSESNSN